MSQDLLAAFGDPPPQSSKPGSSDAPAQSFSFFDDFNSNSAPAAQQAKPNTFNDFGNVTQSITQAQRPGYRDVVPVNRDDDDDWGDFEGSSDVAAKPAPARASIPAAAKPAPVPVATQFSRWLDEENDGFPDYAQTAAAPKTNAKWDFTKPAAPAPQARDPNVLFDAEDEPPVEDDDDEFGDFEGAEQSVKTTRTIGGGATNDLLGMDDFMEQKPPTTSKAPQVQQSAAKMKSTPIPTASNSLLDLEDLTLETESTNAWKTEEPTPAPIHGFGTLGAFPRSKSPTKAPASPPKRTVRKKSDAKPVRPPPAPKQRNVLRKAPPPQAVATDDDEHWDDFEAWTQESSIPTATTPKPKSAVRNTQHHDLTIPPSLTSSSADSSLSSPPTNIPPPALVLSLFSTLFSSSETFFFKPLRQESATVQQAIYSDAAATTYLKGLLALATVCGRVIAGRKHRWKRDTILAQSMRIGPSAAGGVSGLKLTSIDKAEVAKEDREAADALRAWQGVVGKLKSAVAEVKRVTGGDVGKIPELKETLIVKVAKEIEGGLKGNRPCALCGLKREERVLKVDFRVEDSFGEWWVDNVSMHRDCRNFWEQHRDSLRSR